MLIVAARLRSASDALVVVVVVVVLTTALGKANELNNQHHPQSSTLLLLLPLLRSVRANPEQILRRPSNSALDFAVQPYASLWAARGLLKQRARESANLSELFAASRFGSRLCLAALAAASAAAVRMSKAKQWRNCKRSSRRCARKPARWVGPRRASVRPSVERSHGKTRRSPTNCNQMCVARGGGPLLSPQSARTNDTPMRASALCAFVCNSPPALALICARRRRRRNGR